MKRLRSVNWQVALNRLATVSVIVACASVVWLVAAVHPSLRPARPDTSPGKTFSRRPSPPIELPKEPVSLANAAVLGRATSAVGIVAYSDFQCPFCAKFATDTMPELQRKYIDTGKVLFAFRHLPLEAIHPTAKRAAEATECARRQSLFWPAHDLLFANPSVAKDVSAAAFADVAGLDLRTFGACLKGQAESTISADVQLAKRLRITGTPSFLIGTINSSGELVVTHRESGAIPLAAFEAVIDPLLSKEQAIK